MSELPAIQPGERLSRSVAAWPNGEAAAGTTSLLGDRKSPAKAAIKKWILPLLGVKNRLPRSHGLLLTFDDGPDPVVTTRVLDQLARYGAKAVFFIVGNRIPKAPHLIPRIIEEGHVIGNHTYAHPLDGTPPVAEYYRDVQKCQVVLESHTGRPPQLFRPPLGSLTLGSLVAARLLGLQTMLWSIDVDDWKLRREADAVQLGHRLAEMAGPGDIVLLHDDNPCVVTVLETALPLLRERQVSVGEALAHV